MLEDNEDSQRENPDEKGVAANPDTRVVPLEERLKRINEQEIDYDLIAFLIKTLLRTKYDDGSILGKHNESSFRLNQSVTLFVSFYFSLFYITS